MNLKMNFFFSLFLALLLLLPLNSLFADVAQTNPYLDLGIFAYEEKDHKAAIAHLKRAMLKQPANPLTYHYLGKTYLDLKRFEESRQSFDKAFQIKPDLDGLLYDIAYLEYMIQNYPDALTKFSQVFKKNSKNVMASYYAANSAFKLQRYKTAIKYFKEVSKSPNAKENSEYYIAVCYLQIGKTKKSRELFNRIKQNSKSKTLKKNADQWLNYLKKNEKSFRPYHLYINIALTYDDNVKLISPEDKVSDKDDCFFKAFLGGAYNLVQSPIFKVGVGYRHFQTMHVDLSEYNLINSTGEFFLIYNSKDTIQSLHLSPEKYWLDSKVYMTCQRIRYDVQWQKSKEVKIKSHIGFVKNSYSDTPLYDGQAVNMGLGMESIIPGYEKWKFSTQINAENNSTKGPDKKYKKGHLKCAFTYKYKDINLSFGGDYLFKHYYHVNRQYDQRRRDSLLKMNTSVSLYKFKIQPVLKIEHLINTSTIDDFDYDKTAITASVLYTF